MDESRLLILGANGQVGRALQARFPGAKTADIGELDISDWASVAGYDWSGVDAILNAACFTNVDGAESPQGRETAWKVNAAAVGYLAKIAVIHDLTLVHISTEYVFDGTKAPHTEQELFTPLGVYAQTKAAGDIAAAVAPKHYILRTSWVIGDGHNFVRIMMGLAERNISPNVVQDQIGRLTFATTLAEAIELLITKKPEYGTYNVSGGGEPASWADVTRAIFKELQRDDLTVTDVTTAEYFKDKPAAAPRPLKSIMDLAKIQAAGLNLHDWRDDLRTYIAAELAKPKE